MDRKQIDRNFIHCMAVAVAVVVVYKMRIAFNFFVKSTAWDEICHRQTFFVNPEIVPKLGLVLKED